MLPQPQQQVSSTAGWDATPGRSDEWGLSEGQPLSLRRYRHLYLIAGVALPALSIAAEAATRWSGAVYANPFPSRWLLAVAGWVPLANFVCWFRLCQPHPPAGLVERGAALRWLNLLALAVSLAYSLFFLPVIPVALLLSIVGVGWLPLSPFLALYTAWRFRQALPRSTTKRGTLLRFLSGVPALSTARSLLCQSTE